MSITKKLGLAFGKTLIALSILTFALGFLFVNTLSTPNKIKFWLNESDLYPAVADSIQEQFLSEDNNLGQIPDGVIKDSINKTFDGSVAKGFIEGSIDTIYVWLNGKQENLSIALDTKMLQQKFADNVGSGLLERYSNLPTCTSLSSISVQSLDLLELQCVPPGVDIKQVAGSIVEQIKNQTDSGFDDGTITFAPQSEGDNKEDNLASQLKPARDTYQILKLLPYISAGMFAIGAAIVVLLSDPRYKALRTLAVASIPYGILYIIGGLLLPNIITSSTHSAVETIEQQLLRVPLQKVIDIMSKDIGQDLINLGAILVASGGTMLLIYLYIKKKNPPTGKESKTEHKPDVAQSELKK